MVDHVKAGAPIVAGVGLALVHFIFTVHSLETRFARAPITTPVVIAGGTVETGVGQALVHLLVTVTPHVALLAVAPVGLVYVLAAACVLAHFIH